DCDMHFAQDLFEAALASEVCGLLCEQSLLVEPLALACDQRAIRQCGCGNEPALVAKPDRAGLFEPPIGRAKVAEEGGGDSERPGCCRPERQVLRPELDRTDGTCVRPRDIAPGKRCAQCGQARLERPGTVRHTTFVGPGQALQQRGCVLGGLTVAVE